MNVNVVMRSLNVAAALVAAFFATGVLAQPVISVTGATSFPATLVGSASSVQAITISNVGTATLLLNGVSNSNALVFQDSTNGPAPNASHYCGFGSLVGGAPNTGTPIPINVGSSCVLNLIFKPNAATAFNATITLASNAASSPNMISLSGSGITGAAPAITSASSVTGLIGVAFNHQIVATNTPFSFAVTGLPAGLTLNAATGNISGTPTATGIFSTNVSATNASGTATQTLTISIASPTVVTTISDSGAGSLRDAINFVNANCAAQTITFGNPGVGPHPIKPLTALPAITCAGVTIDGYSQSGATVNSGGSVLNNLANLKIVLDGSDPAMQSAGGSGLDILASNVTVRGLAIRSFPGNGIFVTGSNVIIAGNYIGTDPAGTTAFANGGVGVKVNGGTGTQIGDGTPQAVNLITGNGGGGIQVTGAAVNVSINQNMIGGRRDGGAGASAGHGVDFSGGGSNSFVLANRIHGYAGSGVNVGPGINNVRISQNRILFNTLKGIANAGNSGIQRPTITNIAYDTNGAGSTSISGSYVALDNSLHKMEFFENPTTPSVPSGESLFNTSLLNPTSAGTFTFAEVRPGNFKNISLTLRRDVPGDTSEFSNFYLTPISVSPTLVPFSTPAAVPGSQVLTFTNVSNGSLSFTSATISGTGFTKGTDSCSGTTLAALGTCNVTVTFQLPAATTVLGSAVFVVAGGGVTTSFTTPLNGTTTAAAPTSLSLSTSTLGFGVVPVGQVAVPPQTITVTNTGANNLVVSGVSLSGASLSDFTLAGTCVGFIITPASTCTVSVGFTPSAAGARTAQITLLANTAASPHTVALTGTGGVAPTITSASAPNAGTVGIAYTHTFVATATPATIIWSFTTGTLPPGVTLNSTTGVLAGTPTTAGNYAFVVIAANGITPNATQIVSIAIAASPVAPTISSAAPPATGIVGAAYSHNYTASGSAPVTWSVTSGNLPTGLTLNATSGVLSGSPNIAGTFSFTVQAANGTLPNATQPATITIAAATISPILTSAVPPATGLVGVAYSHNYTAGGSAPITWSVINGALPTGLTLNPTSGVLSGLPGVAGVFNFTVQAANGTLANAIQSATITITVAAVAPVITSAAPPASGSVGVAYTHLYTATGTTPITWGVVSGALPGGLTLNPTTGSLSGVPGSAGSISFVVQAANGTGTPASQSGTITIAPATIAPSITSAAPPNGSVGVAYSHTFTAQGTTPVSWSVVSGSLPAGLTLNATSGAISGTPSAAGGFTLTVQAGNGTLPNAVQTFTITIAVPVLAPIITISLSSPSTTLGNSVALSFNITNPSASAMIGGTFNFTYPPGLLTATPASIINSCDGTVSAAGGGISLAVNALALGANSSCSIRVNIISATANNYTLSFPAGAFSASTGSNVTGSNVTLSVANVALPALVLTPNSLNFGARTVNTSSPAQSVIVSNTGTGSLTIASITGAGDFGFTTTCPLTATPLAANASCVISITFTPLTVAALSGRVTIVSDAPGSPHVVSLSGNGSAVAVPGVSLSASALAFSAQTVNTTSATQTVVVGNSGFANLLFNGVSVGAPFTRVATGVNDCASSLAPGSSCLVAVAFAPTAVGEARGQLTISSNATDSPHSVSLTGSGTPVPVAVISPSVANIAFGDQIVNTTSNAQVLTISNTGSANLSVSTIGVSGASAANFTVTGQSGCSSIAPTRSCALSITFTPTTAGAKTAQINVTSNAQNAPTGTTINLTGSGILAPRPIVGLTSTAIGFGNVIFGGATPNQVVTLTNTGGQALSISNLGVVGDFVQTSNCGTTLAALASCTINIVFTPLGQGVRNGELIITSNAVTSPSRVLLSGTGCRWFSQTQSRYFLTSCGS